MVNRVWLHLFGRGLVPTPDNFGAAGQPPSHPELLDHLAVAFMDDGWSVKKLIRAIVLSHAYQLGSRFDPKNFEADPDNALVWRMSPRRLEAEALRDAMLAVSGQLDPTPPTGRPWRRAGEGRRPPLSAAGGRTAIDDRETRTGRSTCRWSATTAGVAGPVRLRRPEPDRRRAGRRRPCRPRGCTC